MASPTPLRRELLASLGIIFAGAAVFLGASLMVVLPFLRSAGEITAFLRRSLTEPVKPHRYA